jgi:hypothetical protein
LFEKRGEKRRDLKPYIGTTVIYPATCAGRLYPSVYKTSKICGVARGVILFVRIREFPPARDYSTSKREIAATELLFQSQTVNHEFLIDLRLRRRWGPAEDAMVFPQVGTRSLIASSLGQLTNPFVNGFIPSLVGPASKKHREAKPSSEFFTIRTETFSTTCCES